MEHQIDLVQGKRVGLITNQTGRLSSGGFLVDSLVARGINVVALFGPEHGIRGVAAAGEGVHDTVDERTGIPIISLYGKTKKPTGEMLKGVDVLVYDIQDVGVRFYTYISTMGLAMEAAAEKGIPFVVLDRPNPLGGVKVDGPIIEDSLRSFLGMFPIPIVYGLTCGELAKMINERGWLAHGIKVDLTVVAMEGWKRSMPWDETGVQWIPPSPNIPTPATTVVYPATCFIEATNVSEGRGTQRPFEFIGAPFINARQLADSLNTLNLTGVQFAPVSFVPQTSKFAGNECHGVEVIVVDRMEFRPMETGLSLLRVLKRLYPQSFEIKAMALRRLTGSSGALNWIQSDSSIENEMRGLVHDLADFQRGSRQFHLYSHP
ncbi:MAG: exo-beta-N-acetylmuramidase NamZ domain-containing protein [Bacteroidota bacterium]